MIMKDKKENLREIIEVIKRTNEYKELNFYIFYKTFYIHIKYYNILYFNILILFTSIWCKHI